MKLLTRYRIAIIGVFCLLMVSSISKSASAAKADEGTTQTIAATPAVTATPTVTEGNQAVSDRETALELDKIRQSNDVQKHQIDKLTIMLLISLTVIVLIGLALIFFSILILNKLKKEHEGSINTIEDGVSELIYKVEKQEDLVLRVETTVLNESSKLKTAVNNLAVNNLAGNNFAVNNLAGYNFTGNNLQNEDEERQRPDYLTGSQRYDRPDESQFRSNIEVPKPMPRSQTFLSQYNKYLSDEIKWNDFQTEYNIEDEILLRIDMSNNREVQFTSSGGQGHIQVFNKSNGDSSNSIAVLKKKEFAAFCNPNMLSMIKEVFDIKGQPDFIYGKVTCIEPALVQKTQGNMYKIIKKGIYSIQ